LIELLAGPSGPIDPLATHVWNEGFPAGQDVRDPHYRSILQVGQEVLLHYRFTFQFSCQHN
jgi:hypothetical protein